MSGSARLTADRHGDLSHAAARVIASQQPKGGTQARQGRGWQSTAERSYSDTLGAWARLFTELLASVERDNKRLHERMACSPQSTTRSTGSANSSGTKGSASKLRRRSRIRTISSPT